MKALIAAGAFLLASAGGAHAQAATTFPFDPWNARAAALGGAGAGLVGIEFGTTNPAGVAGERGGQFSRHVSPSDALDLSFSAAHSGPLGTVEVGFRRRDWGAVARDLGLDDLTAGEQSLSLGYAARAMGGRIRAGASVARLDAEYLGARSSGWAWDAGVQAMLPAGFSAGGALLHGGRIRDEGGDPLELPTQLRGGAGWTGRVQSLDLMAAADLALPTEGSGNDVHAGLEARYPAGPVLVAARGGWRSLGNPYGGGEAERTWTAGVGARFSGVRVDLAQALGGTLGDETFLSLSIHW